MFLPKLTPVSSWGVPYDQLREEKNIQPVSWVGCLNLSVISENGLQLYHGTLWKVSSMRCSPPTGWRFQLYTCISLLWWSSLNIAKWLGSLLRDLKGTTLKDWSKGSQGKKTVDGLMRMDIKIFVFRRVSARGHPWQRGHSAVKWVQIDGLGGCQWTSIDAVL